MSKPTLYTDEEVEILRNEENQNRFWSKVAIRKPEDCWLWQGHCLNLPGGEYGQFWTGKHIKKHIYAHRYSALLKYGNPGELVVLHSCDNPRCVNPHHLSLGTSVDNSQDMLRKNRNRPCYGEHNGAAVLKEYQVHYIRKYFKHAPTAQVADLFGVHKDTIRNVLRRKTWRHI